MYKTICSALPFLASDLSAGTVAFRIFLSLVFASVIGCERANKRHAAGLRTFILVSLASTSAMIIDAYFAQNFNSSLPIISAATVISIAIISCNSILFSSKSQIKGLTTSAGLWACGIIGLTIGAGLYITSTIAFLALLCSLSLFPSFELYLKNRSNHFEIHLELRDRVRLQDFVTTIRQLGLRIDDIELNPAYINSGLSVYSVSLTIISKELKKYKKHHEIIEALSSLEYISHIEEI